MAYNHGREDRKWRIWKEAEEKLLRECGVDEATIEQIRIADRADFNSNRRFYRWTNDIAEYLEDMADRERQTEVGTVAELLDEIESEQIRFFLTKTDRERSYFMDEYQLNTRHSFRHLKIRCNGMKILRSVFQIGKS